MSVAQRQSLKQLHDEKSKQKGGYVITSNFYLATHLYWQLKLTDTIKKDTSYNKTTQDILKMVYGDEEKKTPFAAQSSCEEGLA